MVSQVSRGNGAHGCEAGTLSKTARVASGGLHTTTEGKRLVEAAVQDALNEVISDRKAMIAMRAVDSLVRTTKFEMTLGGGAPVVLVEHTETIGDPLAIQEQELLKQLEAIRKERAAR